MKVRVIILLLLILLTGLVVFDSGQVSAQGDDPLQVITLSKSGYDRGHALAFSPDGKYLAVGGISGIYIFDFQTLSRHDYFETNTWARSLAFLPGINRIAAGLFDNTIRSWDVASGKEIHSLEGHTGWVRSISISGDGSMLASASDDGTLRIWDLGGGEPILVLSGADVKGIRAVALSPDGKLVAGAPGDKTIRVWNVTDGKLLLTLSGHTDWVRSLAFSADGKLLASGGFDKTVRLWNVSGGTEFQVFEGHESSVLSVAFSPDGLTLASGSVDQTVRLWLVKTGDALQVLRGHTDFVYAVAFSPDGKALASGGGDNSIRIWDLENLDEISATSQEGVGQNISSDCRHCHHRQGQIGPARVIELSCEECHAGGISLSWCTAFPRTGSPGSEPVTYHESRETSGLPVAGSDIAVVIATPGNGETFYARGDTQVPEKINGRIYYSDMTLVKKVEVQLVIMSDGRIIDSFVTNPSSEGEFIFDIGINTDAPIPALPPFPTNSNCVTCHKKLKDGGGFPPGNVRIIVTAIAPDGSQASDERWMRVDPSEKALLPIQVVDDRTGKPVSGLLVQASTVLYQWRARTTAATSDATGNVTLILELLSQSPTIYQVIVPSQVVNGVQYESDGTFQYKLDTGQTSFPVMHLPVHRQTGRLSGKITGKSLPKEMAGVPIWAVQLPGGPVYKVSLEADSTFVFDVIPISRYLVFMDPIELANRGLSAFSQEVDLIDKPDQDIGLGLMENRLYSGKLVAEDGKSLPFVWVTVGDNKQAIPLYPIYGEYMFSDSSTNVEYMTFSAPGYYSEFKQIDSNTGQMDIQLSPKPGMKTISWGNGQVTIPPETSAKALESIITIEHGWLWGSGGSSQPLKIRMQGCEMVIFHGEFALETSAGAIPWLYLYEGSARVTYDNAQSSIELGSGQMIALVAGADPIPLDQSVITGYHPVLDQMPIPETVEPSLKTQFENRLLRAGINLAQGYAFVAYFLSIGVLIAMPVFILLQRARKQRKPSRNSKNS